MSINRSFVLLVIVFACFAAACSGSSVSTPPGTDGDLDAESVESADGDTDTAVDGDSTPDGDGTDAESADEAPALDGDTDESETDSPAEQSEGETDAPDQDAAESEAETDSDADGTDSDAATCVPETLSCIGTKVYRCTGDDESLVTDCGPVGCAAGSCTVEEALAYDGSSAYVDFGSTFILYGLDVYTVEAWFIWNGTTDGSKTYQIYSEGYNDYGALNVYINGKGALSMKEFNQTTGVNHWVSVVSDNGRRV